MSTQLVKPGQTDIVRADGIFDLTPRSFSEAIQIAEYIAKTDMVPPQFKNKPGDILVAIQYGQELGVKPLQALQGIAVINGRPTVWGDLALAVVLDSGLMENHKEMTLEEIEVAGKAVFWAKRKGTPEPIVREFSIENAKKARLWAKPGTWQDYPYRMLQMRARAWGLRDGFSDVLKGLAIREEVEDTEVTEAPTVLAMPRRLSERQVEPPKDETVRSTEPPDNTTVKANGQQEFPPTVESPPPPSDAPPPEVTDSLPFAGKIAVIDEKDRKQLYAIALQKFTKEEYNEIIKEAGWGTAWKIPQVHFAHLKDCLERVSKTQKQMLIDHLKGWIKENPV